MIWFLAIAQVFSLMNCAEKHFCQPTVRSIGRIQIQIQIHRIMIILVNPVTTLFTNKQTKPI